VIAQCPFTDGLASALALDPLSSVRVMALAVRDQLGAWMGKEPVMVAAAGKPGATALMTAPDAMDYLKLLPAGAEASFPNYVAARFGLQIVRYFPGRKAAKIACPVLFCVCETDSVAPAAATLRHARRAPQGEIKRYPEGHFDIYVGDAFERVVHDQIHFLHRVVPLA